MVLVTTFFAGMVGLRAIFEIYWQFEDRQHIRQQRRDLIEGKLFIHAMDGEVIAMDGGELDDEDREGVIALTVVNDGVKTINIKSVTLEVEGIAKNLWCKGYSEINKIVESGHSIDVLWPKGPFVRSLKKDRAGIRFPLRARAVVLSQTHRRYYGEWFEIKDLDVETATTVRSSLSSK